jgi:deoxyadenosine/deoxycytidine kinase
MPTPQRKRFIALAGNIGAGKTELVGFLGRRYGVKPVFEPNDENPYLADFYRDMKAHAFQSQVWFLAHKVRLHLAIQDEPGTVIQDRTIYEDAEIFAESLYRRGILSARDHATYRELYEVSAATLAPPDLLVYLRAGVPTLKKRIARRGRESERDLPRGYLASLNRLYEEWIAGYDRSPVLTLETDDLDWLTDLVDRIDVLQKIERYL